jgi:hypothetical protein
MNLNYPKRLIEFYCQNLELPKKGVTLTLPSDRSKLRTFSQEVLGRGSGKSGSITEWHYEVLRSYKYRNTIWVEYEAPI